MDAKIGKSLERVPSLRLVPRALTRNHSLLSVCYTGRGLHLISGHQPKVLCFSCYYCLADSQNSSVYTLNWQTVQNLPKTLSFPFPLSIWKPLRTRAAFFSEKMGFIFSVNMQLQTVASFALCLREQLLPASYFFSWGWCRSCLRRFVGFMINLLSYFASRNWNLFEFS